MSLIVIPGATTSPSDPNGGEIQSAQTVAGTIDTWADTDAFVFAGRAGDGVVIDLTKACSTAAFYPEVRLYDPLGRLEASDWSSANAEIHDRQLLLTRVYTVVIKDWSATTPCDYRASLLLVPGPTVSPGDQDGGTIASGQVKAGLISAESDTDAYAMVGQAGNTIVVNLTKTCGTPAFYPEVRLYDPFGRLEASAWSSSNAEILNHHLLLTGVYALVDKDWYGLTPCTYNLSLTKIPPTVVLGLLRECDTGWNRGQSRRPCDRRGRSLQLGVAVRRRRAVERAEPQSPLPPVSDLRLAPHGPRSRWQRLCPARTRQRSCGQDLRRRLRVVFDLAVRCAVLGAAGRPRELESTRGDRGRLSRRPLQAGRGAPRQAARPPS